MVEMSPTLEKKSPNYNDILSIFAYNKNEKNNAKIYIKYSHVRHFFLLK